MMREVAIRPVSLKSGDMTVEVVGLVTTGGMVSSMSERLADKLNITKESSITFSSMGCDALGYLPDRAVEVTCGVNRKAVGWSSLTLPVAFVIIPSSFDELVLGNDWLNPLGEKLGGSIVFNSEIPSRFTDANYMLIDKGRPTPGPRYKEDTHSFCHLIEVNEQDGAKLKELVKRAEGVN